MDAEYVAQKNLMSVDELYAKVETDAALKAELESAPRTQQLLESIAAKVGCGAKVMPCDFDFDWGREVVAVAHSKPGSF